MPTPSSDSLLRLEYVSPSHVRPSDSFISSSSQYSEITEPIFDEQCFGAVKKTTKASESRDGAAFRDYDTDTNRLLFSKAKTSSSASLDRFQYDEDPYSVFLKAGTERDVSNALRALDNDSTISYHALRLDAIDNDKPDGSAMGTLFYNSDAVPSA